MWSERNTHPLGGPDVSWGGLSNLPSGHSRRGIPCQRRPRPGEKPSGVSAFVGVKGEDIRTLRARRPEASAVCRKAAGSRPHPATISHMGDPLSAICGSTLSHMWFHMPAICSSTYPWTPWHSTSNGVAKGMVEGAGSGMAGVRDNLQQLVERRTPSVAGQMRFHGAEAVGGTGLGCGGPWGLHSERSAMIKGTG
jgi:hypothetical protein